METQINAASSKRRAKFAVGGVAVVLMIAGLIAWAMTRPGSTAFYLTVSELSESTGTGATDYRVNGNVVPDTLERDGVTTSFAITDGRRELDIVTDEALPDAFWTAYKNDPGSVEIVAEGRYDGHTFAASQVLAKCPSKFKAQS